MVVWVHLCNQLSCNNVEHGDHKSRFLSQPDGKCWYLVGQVSEVDLERLLVVLAHLFNPVLVRGHVGSLITMGPDEVVELSLDEPSHFSLLDPLRDLASSF